MHSASGSGLVGRSNESEAHTEQVTVDSPTQVVTMINSQIYTSPLICPSEPKAASVEKGSGHIELIMRPYSSRTIR